MLGAVIGYALWFGIFSLVALGGGIFAIKNLNGWKRQKRIFQMQALPIVHAAGNEPVKVLGRVLPSEQGVVQTPISGRQAVWYRLTVCSVHNSRYSYREDTVLTEADGRAFLLDDGSGQRARVFPRGANIDLDSSIVAVGGTDCHYTTPQVEAFIRTRGLTSSSILRFQEEVIAPGDPLFALGPARRNPPIDARYHMAPTSELVLFHGDGPEGALVLTNDDVARGCIRGCILGFIVSIAVFAFFAFCALFPIRLLISALSEM